MWQFETELLDVIPRAPEIKTFRWDARQQEGITYEAGQFFFVTIRLNGRDGLHHFTISSSPTETAEKGYLEFTKRITSSEYSQTLNRMKKGDWGRLRGPEGDFVLPGETSRLAFLSGGIGITPLRSMIRYTADRGLRHDISLIYGNNTWENIAFHDELEQISQANKNVRVEYVLSGPDFPPGWQGKKGFITKDLVLEVIPDCRERIFYLSGPLRMVLALEEQLASIPIPRERIKRDYFPGYD